MFTSSISIEGLQSLLGGKDPVCGKELQPSTAASTTEKEGKTLYFCSSECRTKFDAEPDKYIACC